MFDVSHQSGLNQFGVASYGDVLGEARRCREQCALFDFSFVSRAVLKGAESMGVLTEFQTRDLRAMKTGEIRYALRCQGGESDSAVLSDLTVWKTGNQTFEVYSGRSRDLDALQELCSDRGFV